MKRVELVRKIENMGCVLIRHGVDTIGIRTQKPEFLSRFHGIVKLLTVW